MRQLRYAIALGAFIGLAYLVFDFLSSNAERVILDLPGIPPVQTRLAFALLSSFVLGALAASLVLLVKLARKSLGTRRLQRQVAGLESELRGLRPPAPPEPASQVSAPSLSGRSPDA